MPAGPGPGKTLCLRHVFVGMREIRELKRDLKAGKHKEIELLGVQVTAEGWNEISTAVVESHYLMTVRLEDVVLPVKALSALSRWSKAAVGRSLVANNSNSSEVRSVPTAITDPQICSVSLELEISYLKSLDIDYVPSPPHLSWVFVSQQLIQCRDKSLTEVTNIKYPTFYLGPVGLALYNYSVALTDTNLKQSYIEVWLTAVGRAYDTVINKSRLHTSTAVTRIVAQIVDKILSKEYIDDLSAMAEDKAEVLRSLFNTYAQCSGIDSGEFTDESLLVFVSSLKVDSMIPRESGTPLDRLAIAQSRCIRAVEIGFFRKNNRPLSSPVQSPIKSPPVVPPKGSKVTITLPSDGSPRRGDGGPAPPTSLPTKVPLSAISNRVPSDQYGLVDVDESIPPAKSPSPTGRKSTWAVKIMPPNTTTNTTNSGDGNAFQRSKSPKAASPPRTEPQLRFRIGDRVLCTVKKGFRLPGEVHGTNVKGNAYLVTLDNGKLIYAPRDVSGYIIREGRHR
eukprot:TRINITY_DN9885_c0_g1_i1.p1 TRINITY_DN9885_c0_g1~~TRINITY_DN9885_c0_g1_i1.p1  ORF type:complete len:508 (+),score=81.01 TRINITY_DN9885_c0_g1_i1:186-1709(+)